MADLDMLYRICLIAVSSLAIGYILGAVFMNFTKAFRP